MYIHVPLFYIIYSLQTSKLRYLYVSIKHKISFSFSQTTHFGGEVNYKTLPTAKMQIFWFMNFSTTSFAESYYILLGKTFCEEKHWEIQGMNFRKCLLELCEINFHCYAKNIGYLHTLLTLFD